MRVEAEAQREINKEGNQVLTVSGVVLSSTQQGVLPAGKDYEIQNGHFELKGGELHFAFSVEAKEPAVPVEVPKLLSELSRHEQEEAFLASQLKGDSLNAEERATVKQKLGVAPEAKDAEQV